MLRKLSILFFILLALLGCSDRDPVFNDTQGNSIKLSELKGKWVIVNYWAGWCPSCVKEIPELNALQKKYKNIVLYGVDFDNLPESELKAAVAKANIDFPVLLQDPNKAWKLDPVEILPTTFIINPAGEVVEMIVGPSSEKTIMNFIHDMQ